MFVKFTTSLLTEYLSEAAWGLRNINCTLRVGLEHHSMPDDDLSQCERDVNTPHMNPACSRKFSVYTQFKQRA